MTNHHITSKELQTSLAGSGINERAYNKIKIEWTWYLLEGTLEAFSLKEEQSCPFKFCQRTLGQIRNLLEVYTLDRGDKDKIVWSQSKVLCLEKIQHWLQNKPHSNNEV